MTGEIDQAIGRTLYDIQMQCSNLEAQGAKRAVVYAKCVALGAAVYCIKYGNDAASDLPEEVRFLIGTRILSDAWKLDVEEWLKEEQNDRKE